MKMSLIDKKLHYFYQVVKNGGVRAAAEVLGGTPSVISRHIDNLEKSLGVQLLERHTKGAIPTQIGERLLLCYQQMHGQEEIFRQEISDLLGLRTGKVRISTGAGYLKYLSKLVNDLSSQYPGIAIQINIHGSTEIVRRVIDGETDIGLLYNSINHPQIKSHYKAIHKLCVFMNTSHHLANKDMIRLDEIIDEKVALTDQTYGIRQAVMKVESQMGIALPITVLCNDMNLLKAYALSGGVTILPEFMLHDEDEQLIAKPLFLPTQPNELTSIHSDTQLITRRGRHLDIATQLVLQKLAEMLKI